MPALRTAQFIFSMMQENSRLFTTLITNSMKIGALEPFPNHICVLIRCWCNNCVICSLNKFLRHSEILLTVNGRRLVLALCSIMPFAFFMCARMMLIFRSLLLRNAVSKVFYRTAGSG